MSEPFPFSAVVGQDEAVRLVASAVTYGWGVIPVRATLNGLTFATSLFPKDGLYLLPLKAAVRTKLAITVGDAVDVAMTLGPAR